MFSISPGNTPSSSVVELIWSDIFFNSFIITCVLSELLSGSATAPAPASAASGGSTCSLFATSVVSLLPPDQRPDFDPDAPASQEAASRADSEATAVALNYAALEKAVRTAEKADIMLRDE